MSCAPVNVFRDKNARRQAHSGTVQHQHCATALRLVPRFPVLALACRAAIQHQPAIGAALELRGVLPRHSAAKGADALLLLLPLERSPCLIAAACCSIYCRTPVLIGKVSARSLQARAAAAAGRCGANSAACNELSSKAAHPASCLPHQADEGQRCLQVLRGAEVQWSPAEMGNRIEVSAAAGQQVHHGCIPQRVCKDEVSRVKGLSSSSDQPAAQPHLCGRALQPGAAASFEQMQLHGDWLAPNPRCPPLRRLHNVSRRGEGCMGGTITAGCPSPPP